MRIPNDIFRFVKHLALLLLFLFVGDRLLGWGLGKLYFGLKNGQYAQMTYSIDSVKDKDILIFGSSRAVRHYSAKIITKNTGWSCFNLGKDAQFVPFYAAVQEAALRRSTPKVIILDMNTWEFNETSEKYEKLSMLLPYAPSHPELLPYIDQVSRWERYKLFSKAYPFNSTLLIALHDRLLGDSKLEYANGYLPLQRTISPAEYASYQREKREYEKNRAGFRVGIDQKAVTYYTDFLNRAKARNIRVYVIISPSVLNNRSTKAKELIGQIAARYPNVTFKDYSYDPHYLGQYKKFADVFHLNEVGSHEFSQTISTLINR